MQIDGTTIKELYKLLNKKYILITLIVASGIILFLPDDILNKMYMLSFRNKSGFILGLIFWFSITLLIVIIGVNICKRYKNKYINKKICKGMKKFLLGISNRAEVDVITNILKNEDYTLELPVNNGVVIKLRTFGIIIPAGSSHFVEMNNPHIPFFMQPAAINIIANDEVLRKKFKYRC